MNDVHNNVTDGAILTDDDRALLTTELENVVANLKWVSLEMQQTSGLSNTWMNLEIDRRHIMRELHAGRRLAVQDQATVDLGQPFELDTHS